MSGSDLGGLDTGDSTDMSGSDLTDTGEADMDLAQRPFVRSVGFTDIAACAATADRRVFCWGTDDYHLINTADEGAILPPTERPDLKLQEIDGGLRHFCGIGPGGVTCWGSNEFQQVRPTPSAIADPTVREAGVTGLTVGGFTSCARSVDGVRGTTCWGLSPGYDVNAPAGPGESQLLTDQATSQVAMGQGYYCRTAPPNIVCEGFSPDGRAGRADGTVTGVPAARTRIATDLFTCMLYDSTVHCLGSNDVGQLGGGAQSIEEYKRLNVEAEDLSVGRTHACVLLTDGDVECWGKWSPTTTNVAPTRFTAPTGVPFLNVFAGPQVTCASTTDALYCWGNNVGTGLAGQDPAGLNHILTPEPVDLGF